jgi:thymidylate kinase
LEANCPKKVAVTGAHGTGKTTLISAVFNRLKPEFDVTLTAEVPRLFIEDFGDPTFFQRGNNSFARQTMILARQIELESHLAQRGHQIILCDRTVVDHWAYTETLFPIDVKTIEGRGWRDMVKRWLDSYKIIVGLPIEFPIELDNVREADEQFQHEIDQKIAALYLEFGRNVPTITGARKAREEAFIAAICMEPQRP